MQRLNQFAKAVRGEWVVVVTGPSVNLLLLAIAAWKPGLTVPRWAYVVIGLSGLLAAFYRVWLNAMKEKEQLQRQLADRGPTFELTLPKEVTAQLSSKDTEISELKAQVAQLRANLPRRLIGEQRERFIAGLCQFGVPTQLVFVHAHAGLADGSDYQEDFVNAFTEAQWQVMGIQEYNLGRDPRYKDGISVLGSKPGADGKQLDLFLSQLLTSIGISNAHVEDPHDQPTIVIGRAKAGQS